MFSSDEKGGERVIGGKDDWVLHILAVVTVLQSSTHSNQSVAVQEWVQIPESRFPVNSFVFTQARDFWHKSLVLCNGKPINFGFYQFFA